MRSSAAARRTFALLAGAGAAVLLLSCAGEPRPAPPAPPLPADLSGFDPAIAERIEDEAAGLRRDPRDGRRWRRLGMLYHAHDRFDLAAECYRESRSLAPEDPKTHFYLALIEQRLGRTAQGIAGLERVIELDRGYAPARWRLALAHLEEGEAAAAREAAQGALAVATGDRAATLVLARARLQAAEAAAAADLLESHLAAHPGDRYAHFLLGGAYRRLGREEAQRHLALGQGAEPDWSDPWSDELEDRRAGIPARLAAATELLGPEPARAVAELERLRAERPENVTVLINLGIGYRRTGRLADSAEALRRAVEREPGRGLGLFHLAVTTSEMSRRASGGEEAAGLLEQALEHAGRAVELQPTSAKNHALLGEILAQAGRPAEAVESYRRAARDPQDPAWLHRLGALYCQLQRWDEAIPVLEDFLARAGEDADALFLLGAAQANAGELDAAAATLERARRRSPEDPKIVEALARLERARRKEG